MMPLSDDDSMRRTTPVVTYGLIAVNVLVFLLELNSGDAFIERWAFVPARFLADPAGDFATLFTSMFMHAGWVHLLGNMLYLWIFGDNVEDRLGHGMFLVFYILCGLGATFAQMAVNMNSNIPNLGASGAIAGALGAYILMFPRSRVNVLVGRGIVAMPAFIYRVLPDRGRRSGLYGTRRWICHRYGASLFVWWNKKSLTYAVKLFTL